MRDGRIKSMVKSVFFREGAVRRIRFGPLAGMVFRVSRVTGLSPWYSGTERRHQRTFREVLEAGDAAIDVGASWGLHTLCLSRLAGPRGRVLALEPYPAAFEELKWHVGANSCGNAIVMPIAIADFNGESPFVVTDSASTGHLGSNSAALAGTPQVQTRTLDSLTSELGMDRVKLVKIDVEGGESLVLKGATVLTSNQRPHFVVDLHTPTQDVLVGKWFMERGYRLERLGGPPISDPEQRWPDPRGVWGSIWAHPK